MVGHGVGGHGSSLKASGEEVVSEAGRGTVLALTLPHPHVPLGWHGGEDSSKGKMPTWASAENSRQWG